MKLNRSINQFFRNFTLLELGWLFLWLATFSFTQRTAESSLAGSIDAVHFQRFAFVGLAGTIAGLHLLRIPRIRWNAITLFLIYAAIGMASVMWSSGKVATLGKSLEIMVGVVIVWITYSRPDPLFRLRRLITIMLLFHGALLLHAVAGFILFPETFSVASRGVLDRAIVGTIISTNSVANIGALLGLIFLAKSFEVSSRTNASYIYLMGYFLSWVLPIIAQGRTGLVILTVGTFVLIFRKRPLLGLLCIPIGMGLFLTFGDFAFTFFARGQNQEMFLSLSGRTILWRLGWESFLQNPWLGVGFGVGSRTVFLRIFEGFEGNISSVHNGFLEVMLGTGIVGFSIWAICVTWALALAAKFYMQGRELDIIIGFVYVIATTIMSIGVGGWMTLPVGYFLLATAYMSAYARLARPKIPGDEPRFKRHSMHPQAGWPRSQGR